MNFESPYILKIKSSKSELKKVEQFLKKFFGFYKIPEKYFNNTLLCISEAILNSIVHGNKNDKARLINIQIHYKIKEILIKIQDEGDGFDYNSVKNPTIKENIKKESGRGLHIIKSLADKIHHNTCGNCIQFKINCG